MVGMGIAHPRTTNGRPYESHKKLVRDSRANCAVSLRLDPLPALIVHWVVLVSLHHPPGEAFALPLPGPFLSTKIVYFDRKPPKFCAKYAHIAVFAKKQKNFQKTMAIF